MTHTVRLTVQAAERFPDIGTRHGSMAVSETEAGRWYRVDWPGVGSTWLLGADLETVTCDDTAPRS